MITHLTFSVTDIMKYIYGFGDGSLPVCITLRPANKEISKNWFPSHWIESKIQFVTINIKKGKKIKWINKKLNVCTICVKFATKYKAKVKSEIFINLTNLTTNYCLLRGVFIIDASCVTSSAYQQPQY